MGQGVNPGAAASSLWLAEPTFLGSGYSVRRAEVGVIVLSPAPSCWPYLHLYWYLSAYVTFGLSQEAAQIYSGLLTFP